MVTRMNSMLVINVHLHEGLYPSCLQTTSASPRSQPLSHTVPHSPLTHTSTLPSSDVDPFISRTAPLVVHDVNTIEQESISEKIGMESPQTSNLYVNSVLLCHYNERSSKTVMTEGSLLVSTQFQYRTSQ